MKRLTAIVVLLLILLLCCAACGQTPAASSEPEDPPAPSTPSEEAEDTPDTSAPSEETDTPEEPEPQEPSQEEAPEEPSAAIEPGSLAGQLNLEAGLLTPEELTVLESLYGTTQDELMAALSITEENVERREDSMLTLSETREIQGEECMQTFLFSLDDQWPGLYGMQMPMASLTEDSDIADVTAAILETARELYGEPDTYPGLTSISDWLEDPSEEQGLVSETWALGQESRCTIQLHQGNVTLITISYQLDVDTSGGLG